MNKAPIVKRQKAKHQFNAVKLNRGVVLIKNLPHGFYEKQMRKYFSQYGEVTRLRMARSEQTGRSKHFAYIEFKYPEVAKVAAESLNNYIMFRQSLKTVYIPPEKQDHDYFKQTVRMVTNKQGLKRLLTPKLRQASKAVKQYNRTLTPSEQTERAERTKYK